MRMWSGRAWQDPHVRTPATVQTIEGTLLFHNYVLDVLIWFRSQLNMIADTRKTPSSRGSLFTNFEDVQVGLVVLYTSD